LTLPPESPTTRTVDVTPPPVVVARVETEAHTPIVGDAQAEQEQPAASQPIGSGDASDQTSIPSNGESAIVSMVTPRSSTLPEGLAYAKNGLAPVQNDQGFWGYKDASGSWRIAPTFKQARPFDDSGLAAVAVGLAGDLRWGFINSSGNWAFSARFDDAGSFGEERAGYAKVRIGSQAFGQTKYISISGELMDRLP